MGKTNLKLINIEKQFTSAYKFPAITLTHNKIIKMLIDATSFIHHSKKRSRKQETKQNKIEGNMHSSSIDMKLVCMYLYVCFVCIHLNIVQVDEQRRQA